MRVIITYTARPTGFLLIVLFALSLVWCPDTVCQTERGDDQCASLIFALLSEGASAGSAHTGNLSTSCVCICHMPILPGSAPEPVRSLTVLEIRLDSTISIPAYPHRSIDQPPRA